MRCLNLARLTALGGACLIASAGALAQWQWVDASGRKVFSDRPPPADVPEKNILMSPSPVTVKRQTPEAPASGTTSTGTDGAAKKLQAEMDAKKKQAEDADKAKQKAEEARLAAVKAENCKRAQQALQTLQSGVPMRTYNVQGERVFMDEQARAAERNRLEQGVQQNCNR